MNLAWYEILLNAFGVFAAVLAIADFIFSKVGKGKKTLIVILASVICYFAYDKINTTIENKVKREQLTALKADARSVYHSIVITGWENPGDFIGYITQLTSFYQRHSDLFGFEAKTYEAELSNWRALLVGRRKEGKSLTVEEGNDIRGIVNSAKDQMLQIVEKY